MSDILAPAVDHPDRSFPRLHPRPARGWVNDPNGILFTEGRWHLFFQYNPDSARHERICWGHVSSPDLLRWDEHPIALRPQEGGPDAAGCFSGVGALDDGVPTAIYSGVVGFDGRSEVVIARGSSDAETWEQTGHVAARMPADPAITMVRDPFLFELGGRRWALQGSGLAGDRGALLLYAADDLDAWEEHGFLLTSDDEVAAQLPACEGWECPQLVRSGDDWVVLVSLWRDGQPHLGVGYIIGALDIDSASGLPAFRGRASGILDEGAAFYAPQAVQDERGDRVLLWGWAQEVAEDGARARTQEDSDAQGWSGLLTFPRELSVRGDDVELAPARELDALRAQEVDPAALPDQAEIRLSGEGTADLRLGEQVVWRGELGGDDVRILIDASIVEVHPRGRASVTLRAYPAEGEHYAVSAEPGVSATAWRLALPQE
ncbi:glycoside hydrolase family 32 protein [Microbacterium sp. KNMS]